MDERLRALAALDQPLRRRLYDLLGEGWVGRDEAATALDVPRSVAAFHLDRLVEAGVAEVQYVRTSGRTGPGAGRPSKLYRRIDEELTVSLPDRRYELAGTLLAAAVAEADRTGRPVRACLSAVAHDAGRAAGEAAAAHAPRTARRAVQEALAAQGYEPARRRTGDVVLTNCPFHRLADAERTLVCGMNLEYVEGILEGLGVDDVQAALDPAPGRCCVRLSPR